MLLQLQNPNQDNINKLLQFAKQNQLELSLVDSESNSLLPGKQLTSLQLNQLIEKSRNSGIISVQNAHELIRSSYNAGYYTTEALIP